jgi:hypothetical protein
MFITSIKTMKYNTTKYTFAARYELHNAAECSHSILFYSMLFTTDNKIH